MVITKGNNYTFNEVSVITKEDNAVITKGNNAVITKQDNTLLPKEIRNITDTTNNITYNTTEAEACEQAAAEEPEEKKEEGTLASPKLVSREWIISNHNELVVLANGFFKYKDIIVKEKQQ